MRKIKGDSVKKPKDLMGQQFGKLIVLEYAGKDKWDSFLWKCQCDCGKFLVVAGHKLNRGLTKSCGCLRREIHFKDLTGQRFGRLVVICECEERNKTNKILWECVCDCGNKIKIMGASLTYGHTQSCGCLWKESITKHGYGNHPLYDIWFGMIDRCDNPENKNYPNYGGRGIKVCSRWHNIENFIEDVRDWGLEKDGVSLDRIDNDGDYELGNCRAATYIQQANNRRSNILLEFNGEKKTLIEWAKQYDINYPTFLWRFNQGWPMDRVLKRTRNGFKQRTRTLKTCS